MEDVGSWSNNDSTIGGCVAMTRSKVDNEVRAFAPVDLVMVLVEHLVFMKRDSSEGEVQTSMRPYAVELVCT